MFVSIKKHIRNANQSFITRLQKSNYNENQIKDLKAQFESLIF